MNEVNRTLYIPLYGKSYVSKRGLFIDDKKAEEIWEAEGVALKGKSKSKWLAYYMGIRSAVFDKWLKEEMIASPDAVVIHIGVSQQRNVFHILLHQRGYLQFFKIERIFMMTFVCPQA